MTRGVVVPSVFTINETAAYARLSRSTVKRLISAGALATTRPTKRCIRVLRCDIDRFLLERRKLLAATPGAQRPAMDAAILQRRMEVFDATNLVTVHEVSVDGEAPVE